MIRDTIEAILVIEETGGEARTLEEKQSAWQFLIDRGAIWHLDGWYGETAIKLVSRGVCQAPRRAGQ